MNQLSLFSDPVAPVWRPDPERVRARLRRILAEPGDPAAAPWDAARVSLYRIIVPDMARWLPEAEAVDWCAAFEAELARLGV